MVGLLASEIPYIFLRRSFNKVSLLVILLFVLNVDDEVIRMT